MRELRALPAVVGVESQLYPKTWAEVHFWADANLVPRDFAQAVARSGYVATSVTLMGDDASDGD